MDLVGKIKDWSESFLNPEIFLVDVIWKPGSKKISVFIDSDGPLTLDDCRKLNRHLSEKLDEVEETPDAYFLEVSSPGTDRPLKFPRQYKKHIGRELMVKLKAGSELTGKLISADENGIALMLKDAKKGYKQVSEPKELPFETIAESWVQISFG